MPGFILRKGGCCHAARSNHRRAPLRPLGARRDGALCAVAVLLRLGLGAAAAAGALSPNRLFVSPEADWEIDFTPWPAPTLQGGRPFADGSVLGGAPAFLHWVEGELLPVLGARFALDPAQNSVLGYSLGGLFALWAVCQREAFSQCACLSGSLWYPGWVNFLKEHTPKPPQRVYLSLGKKEEKSGPAVMRAVGDATRQSAGLLAQSLGYENTVLEWNPGGHFATALPRWEKALAWLDFPQNNR